MMALNFVNHNQNTIWIALVYGDTGCGPNQFRKQGWWSIPPGQTLNIWDVDLQTVNRHAALGWYVTFHQRKYQHLRMEFGRHTAVDGI
jgi:hypothetical protein